MPSRAVLQKLNGLAEQASWRLPRRRPITNDAELASTMDPRGRKPPEPFKTWQEFVEYADTAAQASRAGGE